MAGASARYRRRRGAQRSLDLLYRQPAIANFIHYSCESFYDRTDGRSSRITSIAVMNMQSRQTASFSIHMAAELKGLSLDGIEAHYDELEKLVLDGFYEHLRQHPGNKWIHWNMRDANYGFQALAHRYRVLGGDPLTPPDNDLFDLSGTLIDIYGPTYVGQSRLESLLGLNGMSRRNFLPGADEAIAFENKNYVKLHQSTLKKVDVIEGIARRAWDGTLRSEARWWDQYGTSAEAFVEGITDHWSYKAIGSLAIVATIAGFILYVAPLLRAAAGGSQPLP